jgi:hypothetical protein
LIDYDMDALNKIFVVIEILLFDFELFIGALRRKQRAGNYINLPALNFLNATYSTGSTGGNSSNKCSASTIKSSTSTTPSPQGIGPISHSELSVPQLSTIIHISTASTIPSLLRSTTGSIDIYNNTYVSNIDNSVAIEVNDRVNG